MSSFRWDLEFGEQGEGLVKSLISSTDALTVEVKRDRKSSVTGNVALEISYKNNPSGIMKTEAKWWAFLLSGMSYDDEVIILIETNRLKRLVQKYKEKRGVVRGGDGKNSELVLIPVEKLLDKLNGE